MRFAIKKAAKLVLHCQVEYNMIPFVQEELEFFCKIFEAKFRSALGIVTSPNVFSVSCVIAETDVLRS